MNLQPYVEDLARRIDPVQEQAVLDAWLDFAHRKNTDGPFSPFGRKKSASTLTWPSININDTLEDEDLMVLYQLCRLNAALEKGSNLPLCIRPNYGVGTMTSMLGAKQYIMPREMNSLPNAIAMGEDGVRKLLEKDVPLFETGFGPKVFRTGEHLREILDAYPELGQFVLVDHPDLQGPMDNTELLWGSDIFYAFYDVPETVHGILQKVVDSMDTVMQKWLQLFPNRYGVACYFFHVVEGSMFIRNDSAMNLSPEMFDEFIVPYDAQLLQKYGGGVHFCGRGDHYIASLSKQVGLGGVNMSQPHLNDMQVILQNTVDKDIPLTVNYYQADLAGHKAERFFFAENPEPPKERK